MWADAVRTGECTTGVKPRRAEVHYCRVSDVSKRKGAPSGQVMIKRFKKIKVVPSALDDE